MGLIGNGEALLGVSILGYLVLYFWPFPSGLFFEILWWIALQGTISLTTTSIAFFVHYPVLMGKRPRGDFSAVAMLWNWPMLLIALIHSYLPIIGRDANTLHEVQSNVFLGGWRFLHTHPELRAWHLIVDLTCELPRFGPSMHYITIPTWDSTLPPFADLDDGLQQVEQIFPLLVFDKPFVVHCANGRGRSYVFLIAVLVQREILSLHHQRSSSLSMTQSGEDPVVELTALWLANTIDHIAEHIRTIRPAVRMKPRRRAYLIDFFSKKLSGSIDFTERTPEISSNWFTSTAASSLARVYCFSV